MKMAWIFMATVADTRPVVFERSGHLPFIEEAPRFAATPAAFFD